MTTRKPIHILGGGFSGLVQAFYLVEKGYPVVIHEKENRSGGLLGTYKAEHCLVEQAANAFISNKALEDMAERIGVTLCPVQPQAKKRFIYRNGKMRRWPLSVSESLPLLQFILQAVVNKASVEPRDGEALRAWGERHWGKAAADYLLEPAMQGIYAASLAQLDAASIIKPIFTKIQRGKLKGSVAPAGGMGEWIDKMQKHLAAKNCSWEWGSGFSAPAQPWILAVGLQALKELAQSGEIHLPPEIQATEAVSLTSMTLHFAKDHSFPQGFGCLFPNPEKMNCKGVLFNHNIFPDRCREGSLETWILNDHDKKFSELGHESLLRAVLADRQRLTGRAVDPSQIFVYQWHKRIPLYNGDLAKLNKALDSSTFPHLLVGNYLGYLGLGKILFRAQDNVVKIERGFFE